MTLGLPALRSEICAGGAALPIKAVQCHPWVSISGSREKEADFFRRTRRTLLGREVFFLLLFFSAAAFFSSPVFHLSKGQVRMDMESTVHQHPASNESGIRHSGRYWQPKGIPTPHPRGNFSYPPPPHDKKRAGRRPCPVCYVPVEQAMNSMPTSSSVSPVLKDLNYIIEENSVKTESKGGSTFCGHPTLQQRSESFDIKESRPCIVDLLRERNLDVVLCLTLMMLIFLRWNNVMELLLPRRYLESRFPPADPEDPFRERSRVFPPPPHLRRLPTTFPCRLPCQIRISAARNPSHHLPARPRFFGVEG